MDEQDWLPQTGGPSTDEEPKAATPLPTSIHIGTLIKAELERQERTVSWFARKLNCDRSNIYKIFRRSTIDTDLLLRVSQVLGHDFFSAYKALLATTPPSGGVIFDSPET